MLIKDPNLGSGENVPGTVLDAGTTGSAQFNTHSNLNPALSRSRYDSAPIMEPSTDEAEFPKATLAEHGGFSKKRQSNRLVKETLVHSKERWRPGGSDKTKIDKFQSKNNFALRNMTHQFINIAHNKRDIDSKGGLRQPRVLE